MKRALEIIGKLYIGGAERVARDIGFYADPEKFQIDYVVFGNDIGAYEADLSAKGCRIFHIPPPSDGYRAYCGNLRKLIRENRYDIVHAHTMFNSGRVSFTHKCVYVNRVIYLCEYLEDGLTVAGRAMRAKNPRGGMFHANLYMASKNSLKVRLKNGLLYTCYGCFAALNPREMAALCDHKALMWLCLPFGYCLYRLWKHQSCMPGSGRDARRFGAE